MKKNRFFAFVSAISLTAGLMFTSCYDNIYSLIEKEVAIDSSGLNGDISHIVRCGNYLFLANGSIYGKEAKTLSETGRKVWKSTSMPVSGSSEFNVSNRVHWLAADDSYVYALASYYEEDDNGANADYKREIYAAKVDGFPDLEWKLVNTSSITDGTSISEAPSIKIIFDNKVGTGETPETGRNAYTNIREKIYKLNGESAPTEQATDGKIIGNDASKIINCVKFKGEDWFSKYYALASNEKYLYYAESYTTGSTNSVTYSNEIHYTENPADNASYTFKTNYSVLSLTLTSDYLFYGTNGGLERSRIDETTKVPTDRNVSFDNNGNSVISEHVYMVYAFDQTKPMAQTDLYCASTIYASISSSSDSYENIGLYCCPANGEWNRDGD
ncbi:hypothetical protein [Treponema sp.]|uniref:hypothetical protein n=1 Tax=Treponema sp. TaxID=166 RepID=UPI00298DED44|nr:hypothetical protein [Treponema sp.]MCQ2240297.1 hypothetical protein [Treponema sp.]